MSMKHVVVTGTSTGLGYGAAQALIERGFRVFGSVRTTADAERVREELGEAFSPLVFDVTDAVGIRAAAATVREEVGTAGLAGLVNNAGIAVPGPIQHLDLDAIRQQFEVNVFGLLAVTQAFLPLLGATRPPRPPPGRVLMMSSVAGRVAMPFLGPYSASKHALEAFSDSLRRELLIYGIDVIVIQPGFIKTPIWNKPRDLSKYEATDYAPVMRQEIERIAQDVERHGLEVETVNRAVVDALTARRPKARYVVAGNPLMRLILPKSFPDRWLDRLISKRMNVEAARKRLEEAETSSGSAG